MPWLLKMQQPRLIAFSVCLLFFLSGFSALIYEVSWMRVLGLILGNTTQAASCVMASFLGGLALGAFLGGKIADRPGKKQLLAYGLAELLVAVIAPLVTLLLEAAPRVLSNSHIFAGPDGLSLIMTKLAVSIVLLLVPTVLMGCTLPLLVKALCALFPTPSQSFNRLYGINTAGAVAGSLAACFYGFAYLGIMSTVLIAAGVNALVGLSVLFAASKLDLPIGLEKPVSESNESSVAVAKIPLLSLCMLSFLLGFTSLSYEVLWTRLIQFHIAPDTYAFTLMVSTFLLGLVLGSWIYDRRVGKDGERQLENLSIVQYGAALLCATSLIFMPFASLWKDFVFHQLVGSLGIEASTLITDLFVTFVYVWPAATMIGISFPLVGGLAANLAKNQNIGRSIGGVYSANTIGCVAGAAVCGLILIPACGSYGAFQWTVTITVITGVVALLWSSVSPKVKMSLCLIPLLLLGLFQTTRSPYSELVGQPDTALIHFAEDTTSSVLVFGYKDFTQLVINGQPYANTILNGRRYMRLLGHLPMLLHNNPSSVLNICFGTGTTAGSVVLHPEVAHLDIVDLSSAVLESAEYFKASNYGVTKRKNVSVHINDGRNHLLFSDTKYDVVTFEPPPPLEAGVVSLYSKEFYELVSTHLKPGGIMCQWMPMDQESGLLWKFMIETARRVFPFVSLWESNDGQVALIGSFTPVKIDFANLSKRLNDNKALQHSLAEVGLSDPHAILSTYLFSQDKLDQLLSGPVKTITDDRPRLEFYLPFAGEGLFACDLERYREPVSTILLDKMSDPDAYAKNLEAMHLLRLADKALNHDRNKPSAHALSLRAQSLVPDNAFFKFASQRTYSAD